MENNSKLYYPQLETLTTCSNSTTISQQSTDKHQQSQTLQDHHNRSQHFLTYASNVAMSQSLIYNSQNAYNIMYGSQSHIYSAQTTFPPPPSFNSYNTQLDSIPWLSDNYQAHKPREKSNLSEKRSTDSIGVNNHQITEPIGIGMCSPLSDSFKSVVYNSDYHHHHPPPHWYYGPNYNTSKSFESLPSCSQIQGVETNSCCRDFNLNSEPDKSNKYCRIQSSDEMTPNTCDSELKNFPSCQLNSNNLMLLGNLEEEHCDVLRMDCCNSSNLASGDFFPSTTDISMNLDLYDRDDTTEAKSSKPGSQCGGESDDIIVEESADGDDETSSSIISDIEDTTEIVYVCVVCNLTSTSTSLNEMRTVVFFRRLDDKALLTRTTQTPILTKLKSITEENYPRTPAEYICNLCLDLVETIDCFEFKLNERREQLISICQKTNSNLPTVPTIVDSTESHEPENEKEVETVEISQSEDAQNQRRICKICNKYFCQSDIHRHKQLHASHINFKCNLCHRSFTMKRLLDNHMKRHNGQRDYLCDRCGKSYIKKYTLDLHMQRHTNSFQYFCSECDKGFVCNTALAIHQRTHTDLKPFQCDICQKNFRTSSHLKEHMNCCSGNFPFSCDQCEKKFASISKLNNHIKLKHEKKFKFICETCSSGFTKDSDYKAHLITHTSDRPHKCNTCGKSYKTIGNLHHHEKIHRQESLYKCETCSREFQRKENWEAHKSVHTGVKPFPCTLCEKRFAIKKHLDAHLARIHPPNGITKKQVCPVCNKELVHSLEEHMRLHSDEKPFKCNVCLMQFTSSGTLQKHVKRKQHFI